MFLRIFHSNPLMKMLYESEMECTYMREQIS